MSDTTLAHRELTETEHMTEAVQAIAGEWLAGSEPPESIAKEWIEAGFDANTAQEWWRAKCFDACRASEMRDEGIDPEQVRAPAPREICFGETLGYAYCNCDLDIGTLLALI